MGAQSPEELVAAGDLEGAAAAYAHLEQWQRAADLYEKVWNYAAAARCYRKAGALPKAMEAAIRARDAGLAADLSARIEDDADKRVALSLLERGGQYAAAADIAADLGEYARAAELLMHQGPSLAAAEMWRAAGQMRQAGITAENSLRVGAALKPDVLAATRLLLGDILFEQSQYEKAVSHYQTLRDQEHFFVKAAPRLVTALARLGFLQAARSTLLQAIAIDDSLPTSLEEVLRAQSLDEESEADLILGRYEVMEELGVGGSGVVYKAQDLLKERIVAVKRFFVSMGQGIAFERFVREVNIAARLNHPNIVRIHDVHESAGIFTMEYVWGGALSQIDRSTLTETQIRKLMLDVVAGLREAHHASVIHRDLKPSNIFVTRSGTAKLGDFGVAHILDLGHTQTGGLIGTLAYMSPEQITGAKIGPAADYYAIGVTLFELLTGQLPFPGPDFIAQHMTMEPPAPSSLGVSEAWDPLVAQLLQKTPGERPATLDEIGDALEELVISDAPVPTTKRRNRRTTQASTIALSETRYEHVANLWDTEISSIGQAIDTVLSRSVIVEEFHTEPDPKLPPSLPALFRVSSPFVQRALSFREGRVIFEAPQGAPLVEMSERLNYRQQLRVGKRLARALASASEIGANFGGLSPERILLTADGIPTILIAGIGKWRWQGSSQDDLQSLAELLSNLSGKGPLAEAIARQAPAKAVDLYALLEDIEIAALSSSAD